MVKLTDEKKPPLLSQNLPGKASRRNSENLSHEAEVNSPGCECNSPSTVCKESPELGSMYKPINEKVTNKLERDARKVIAANDSTWVSADKGSVRGRPQNSLSRRQIWSATKSTITQHNTFCELVIKPFDTTW